ncbi:hypothetical protein [Saccharothrix lopnurensis]|uniref:NB-ARC domain-containing protein n=1 Tax=Saccharothrix lopnurensis TaxID=1670621 RepID=A0ABW1PFV4_9PSEU
MFVEREELARLIRLHDTGPLTLVMVSGPKGIGKTTLTLHWAQRHRDRFATDGYTSTSPPNPGWPLRWCWCDCCATSVSLPVPSSPIPGERAALWRSLTRHRRLLLVLDGVEHAGQVTTLLPAGTDCLTLVVSRLRLPDLTDVGARHLVLRALPEQTATDLLAACVGPERGSGQRRHLAALAAHGRGHPVTMTLLAPTWPHTRNCRWTR